ncbi:MAG: quercetin 2,3-dioxygenase [Frankiaceae bacterium]|jgi:redox-sensitive bicupin YhaK (pirin superfamily)|nr:quercetin 2,3-dioxygenase [Frankiaceae bacterium]
MTVDVRPAATRFATDAGWLDSRHSFSFGQHYDAANTHHGLLLVSNDDVVRPGRGFQTHPHRDMEIVTWVLDGELAHRDTLGNEGVVYPGLAQRMSAGTGIWHSETNARDDADVHFVQMWVRPDTASADPSYAQRDVSTELAQGGLVAIASGRGHDAAISIRQRDAVLWAGRLAPGSVVAVPDNRHVHVFVARGGAALEGAGSLAAGDAARLTSAGSPRLTAGDGGAEVLIWETA